MDDDEIDDWLDISYIGSAYEIQISPSTGKERYRQISHLHGRGFMDPDPDVYIEDKPWIMGKPPEHK